MIKDFLIFAGDCYYPTGGACDVKASTYTYEEAEKIAQELLDSSKHDSWAQILCLHTGKFVDYHKISSGEVKKYKAVLDLYWNKVLDG